jgi:hypothetical protein
VIGILSGYAVSPMALSDNFASTYHMSGNIFSIEGGLDGYFIDHSLQGR